MDDELIIVEKIRAYEKLQKKMRKFLNAVDYSHDDKVPRKEFAAGLNCIWMKKRLSSMDVEAVTFYLT